MTLSFLTYARRLRKQTRAARKAGHEILIHVAVEPDNMKNDPGPRVLLRDLEPDEIQRRLEAGDLTDATLNEPEPAAARPPGG